MILGYVSLESINSKITSGNPLPAASTSVRTPDLSGATV